jgi:hypothetical protein
MKSSDMEQADRRRLAGSTTSATTYRDLAEAGLSLEAQGRHAAKAAVSGSKAVPHYPAASGPWNDPVQVPDEPPLGWSVEAQEPVGETFEIAASSALSPENAADAAPEVSPRCARPQTALLPLGCSLGPSLSPKSPTLVTWATRPHSRRSKVTLTTWVRPPLCCAAANFRGG